MVFCDEEQADEISRLSGLPLMVMAKSGNPEKLLAEEQVCVVTGAGVERTGAGSHGAEGFLPGSRNSCQYL